MNGKPNRQSDDGDVMSESVPTAVPNASTLTNRYGFSGGFAVRDAGLATEEPFDVRSPAVAPDTSATNIWGS